MDLAKLDVAVRSADRGDERGRRACVDAEIQPKSREISLDSSIRVLASKSNQHATFRQRGGWMWGLAPVDEERNDSVCSQHRRNGETPGQQHAIRTSPAAGLCLAKVDSAPLCVFDDCFKVCPFYSPGYQPRGFEFVDAEAPRPGRGSLIRIRPNNLEV